MDNNNMNNYYNDDSDSDNDNNYYNDNNDNNDNNNNTDNSDNDNNYYDDNNYNNNDMNNDYTALNVVDDWETLADNDNINITLNNMSISDNATNIGNPPNIWSNISITTENIMNSSFFNNTISPILITHSTPKIKVNKNIVIKKKE